MGWKVFPLLKQTYKRVYFSALAKALTHDKTPTSQ